MISGGDWPQFEKQLLANLPVNDRLVDLSILPTCGTKFYQYTGEWKKIYSEDFTAAEKEKITTSMNRALDVRRLQTGKSVGRSNRRSWQPDNIFRPGSAGASRGKK